MADQCPSYRTHIYHPYYYYYLALGIFWLENNVPLIAMIMDDDDDEKNVDSDDDYDDDDDYFIPFPSQLISIGHPLSETKTAAAKGIKIIYLEKKKSIYIYFCIENIH